MADDIKTGFRRALDDLNEGLGDLLGLGHSDAHLVGELLEGRHEEPRGQRDAALRRRSRSSPRRPRRPGRRARRSADSVRTHLVLVK